MWSVLVHLWPVPCSTLYHLLHPNACYHTTCPTVSEVPTLSIHVYPDAPYAFSRQAHIVQVFQGHLFGSMTLQHVWDHPHTYKFTTSSCSHFSCSRAKGSLQPAAVPIMLAALGAGWDQLTIWWGAGLVSFLSPLQHASSI